MLLVRTMSLSMISACVAFQAATTSLGIQFVVGLLRRMTKEAGQEHLLYRTRPGTSGAQITDLRWLRREHRRYSSLG